MHKVFHRRSGKARKRFAIKDLQALFRSTCRFRRAAEVPFGDLSPSTGRSRGRRRAAACGSGRRTDYASESRRSRPARWCACHSAGAMSPASSGTSAVARADRGRVAAGQRSRCARCRRSPRPGAAGRLRRGLLPAQRRRDRAVGAAARVAPARRRAARAPPHQGRQGMRAASAADRAPRGAPSSAQSRPTRWSDRAARALRSRRDDAAARRHRQRQDRGLPARRRRGAGAPAARRSCWCPKST